MSMSSSAGMFTDYLQRLEKVLHQGRPLAELEDASKGVTFADHIQITPFLKNIPNQIAEICYKPFHQDMFSFFKETNLTPLYWNKEATDLFHCLVLFQRLPLLPEYEKTLNRIAFSLFSRLIGTNADLSLSFSVLLKKLLQNCLDQNKIFSSFRLADDIDPRISYYIHSGRICLPLPLMIYLGRSSFSKLWLLSEGGGNSIYAQAALKSDLTFFKFCTATWHGKYIESETCTYLLDLVERRKVVDEVSQILALTLLPHLVSTARSGLFLDGDPSSVVKVIKRDDKGLFTLFLRNAGNAIKSFKRTSDQTTLLHTIAYYNSIECLGGWQEEQLQDLLDIMEEEDNEGKTALFWAAQANNYAIVELLLSLGANCRHPSREGVYPGKVAPNNIFRSRRTFHLIEERAWWGFILPSPLVLNNATVMTKFEYYRKEGFIAHCRIVHSLRHDEECNLVPVVENAIWLLSFVDSSIRDESNIYGDSPLMTVLRAKAIKEDLVLRFIEAGGVRMDLGWVNKHGQCAWDLAGDREFRRVQNYICQPYEGPIYMPIAV